MFRQSVVLSTGWALADQHIKACHDAAWTLDEFNVIPNAGISAYPGGYADTSFYAYWIVDWDNAQAAGKCLMKRDVPTVQEFTRFSKS